MPRIGLNFRYRRRFLTLAVAVVVLLFALPPSVFQVTPVQAMEAQQWWGVATSTGQGFCQGCAYTSLTVKDSATFNFNLTYDDSGHGLVVGNGSSNNSITVTYTNPNNQAKCSGQITISAPVSVIGNTTLGAGVVTLGVGVLALFRVPLSCSDGSHDVYFAPGITVVANIQLRDGGSWQGDVKAGPDFPPLHETMTIHSFDFTLSASFPASCGLPPTGWVHQGEKISLNINVALSAGTPQPVTLSVSRITPPTGIAVSLSQGTVTPNGASTLTVATTPSTPVGTYVIVVQGMGGPNPVSHSTVVTLHVDQAEPQLPTGVTSEYGTHVEVQHAGSNQWVTVDATYKPQIGDTIRTESQSLVVLKLGPDSITLSSGSQIFFDYMSSTSITYLATGQVYQSLQAQTKVVSGRFCNGMRWDQVTTALTSVMSHTPASSSVSSMDPTRFLLSSTNTTSSVQVYEGTVSLNDSSGHSVTVPAGSQSSVVQGAAPSTPTLITDKTSISVTSVYPSGPQQSVNYTAPISIAFTKPLNPSSVAGSNFTVVDSKGSPVGGNWTILFQRAVFLPTHEMPADTYTVTVKGGAHGVKDLMGNPLQSDYTFSFTSGTTIVPEFPLEPVLAMLGALAVGIIAVRLSTRCAHSTSRSTYTDSTFARNSHTPSSDTSCSTQHPFCLPKVPLVWLGQDLFEFLPKLFVIWHSDV